MHSNAVIIHTLTGLRYTQCPKCQERHVLSPGFVHGSHLCCKGCGENLLLQELSMGELENFTQQVGLVNDPRCFDTPPSALAVSMLKSSEQPMWGSCSGITERDSSEADAAQALFVEFGFSSQWVIAECNPAGWGLVRYADFERWSQKQAAGKLTTLKEELATRGLPQFGQPMVNWNLGERRASFTMCPPRLRFPIERPPVGGGKTAAMLGALAHAEFAKYCEADINSVKEFSNTIKQSMIRRLVAKAAFKLGASATLGIDSPRQRAKQKEIKTELASSLKLYGIPYSEIELIISELVEGLRNE